MGEARINSGAQHWRGNHLFKAGELMASVFPQRQKSRQPWAERKGVIVGWGGWVLVSGTWQITFDAKTRNEMKRVLEAILALEA